MSLEVGDELELVDGVLAACVEFFGKARLLRFDVAQPFKRQVKVAYLGVYNGRTFCWQVVWVRVECLRI